MLRSGVDTVRFGEIYAGYKEIWGRYTEIWEQLREIRCNYMEIWAKGRKIHEKSSKMQWDPREIQGDLLISQMGLGWSWSGMERLGVDTARSGEIPAGYKEIWVRYREIRRM
jgi:hypothetical protein